MGRLSRATLRRCSGRAHLKESGGANTQPRYGTRHEHFARWLSHGRALQVYATMLCAGVSL
eukprot:1178343-Prorocentrum_minimum.AAC.4